MTSQEIELTKLAEQFYNAMRGFIVIEESGLPKYIEFLTEEQIDVVLLAGLLSGLQSLAEVISEEKINSIETSNSKFIFVTREKYFYVLWIEKRISDLELYNPIIMKIISRFEGASSSDIENTLLISNLTETPDYEKIGQRITKFRSMDASYTEAYRKLDSESLSSEDAKTIADELVGIDGVLIITEDGVIEHFEFSKGDPIFDINILTNFLTGLRKSIRNLDPGRLIEVTTKNYRFIIHDSGDYFYVFEVIKGLAEEKQLENIMQRIVSRYEGLRRKSEGPIVLLKDFESVPEHELLGQLSLEMRDLQGNNGDTTASLGRQTSKVSFGDDDRKWLKEEDQLCSFMDIYTEVFMAGVVCPDNKFFVIKKTPDINTWIKSVKDLELNKLLELTEHTEPNQVIQLSQRDKIFLLHRITDNTIIFAVSDKSNSAVEGYLIRLSKIIKKISKNIS
ncbi:MAG: hypothetical protein KGD59_11780 [Candidatus Heimdallarchaeota archaeon]|nr:hypothetical protein [Candidatus Heimdallarchaeota archaeon]MBY8995224.1 hypothetical protein [Candidatus Heimdallarchaeota archaeon]